jgi:hypothetical protein
MEYGTNRSRPETKPSPSEPSEKSRTLENRGLRLRGETAEKLPNFSILLSRIRYPSRQYPKIAGLSAITAIGLE